MPTEAQRRAYAKFAAAHIVQISIKLNDNQDADIIAKLDKVSRSEGGKQGYIKTLIRADIEKEDGKMKYLNDHKDELFEGKKITYRGKVYWANMVTREVYAHSVDAEIKETINGYKVADITDDWKIVPV